MRAIQQWFNNGSGVAPLLDLYPNAKAAYSLYKLRSAYLGYCVRVRNASNNFADIGFVGNTVDVSAILAHCGFGNGFIHTWYDQSGNGLNLASGSNSAHPQIVSSGAMITNGLKYSVKFPTATMVLSGGAASDWKFMHVSDHSIYMTLQPGLVTNPNAEYAIMGTNNGTSAAYGFFLDWLDNGGANEKVWHFIGNNSGGAGSSPSVNLSPNGTLPANSLHVLSVVADPTNPTAAERSKISVDNGPVINLNTYTNAIGNVNPPFALQLGGYGNSSGSFIGYISELIIYPTKKNALDDAGIQTHLGNFYGITMYPDTEEEIILTP